MGNKYLQLRKRFPQKQQNGPTCTDKLPHMSRLHLLSRRSNQSHPVASRRQAIQRQQLTRLGSVILGYMGAIGGMVVHTE